MRRQVSRESRLSNNLQFAAHDVQFKTTCCQRGFRNSTAQILALSLSLSLTSIVRLELLFAPANIAASEITDLLAKLESLNQSKSLLGQPEQGTLCLCEPQLMLFLRSFLLFVVVHSDVWPTSNDKKQHKHDYINHVTSLDIDT